MVNFRWFRPDWSLQELAAISQMLRDRSFPKGVAASSAGPRYRNSPSAKELSLVVEFDGRRLPSIRMARGEPYGVDEIIQGAREEKKPLTTPHVRFASLEPGNTKAALTFLRDFGPLEWTQGTLDVYDWVNLDHFWARQARFYAVTRLWHALRESDAAIDAAWEWIEENDPKTRLEGEPPLGQGKPIKTPQGMDAFTISVPMPWKANDLVLTLLPFVSLAADRPHEMMGRISPGMSEALLRRRLAIALVQYELTQQTEAVQTIWTVQEDGTQVHFLPSRHVTSLWGVVWELFAAETVSGLCWRFCRECGKPFYPSRIDSECCSSVEQAAWSKRQYHRKWRKK